MYGTAFTSTPMLWPAIAALDTVAWYVRPDVVQVTGVATFPASATGAFSATVTDPGPPSPVRAFPGRGVDGVTLGAGLDAGGVVDGAATLDGTVGTVA